MTDRNIIFNCLKSIIEKYNFIFKFNTNGKELFLNLVNKHGSFNFYEYSQFQEYEFSITINGVGKNKIDIFDKYKELENDFNRKHKGFIWIFKDKRLDFWKLILAVMTKELDNTGKLFGLNIEK